VWYHDDGLSVFKFSELSDLFFVDVSICFFLCQLKIQLENEVTTNRWAAA
jgi:hypothetical protein